MQETSQLNVSGTRNCSLVRQVAMKKDRFEIVLIQVNLSHITNIMCSDLNDIVRRYMLLSEGGAYSA